MNPYPISPTRQAVRYASACAAIVAVLFWTAGHDLSADDLEPVHTFATERGGYVGDARFSADGKNVFTTGNKPAVGVWNTKTGKAVKSIELTGGGVVMGLSADGGLGVGFVKNMVVVWDLESGKQLTELKGHTEAVLSARLSADGTRAVTASRDKTAKVWEATTGKLVTTLTGHEGPVASAEFSADGTRVASAATSERSKSGTSKLARSNSSWSG
jgi:WD40 repeat protein